MGVLRLESDQDRSSDVDKLWQHLNNSEILAGTATVFGEGNQLNQIEIHDA